MFAFFKIQGEPASTCTMALENGNLPPAQGECRFYSSFTFRDQAFTLVILCPLVSGWEGERFRQTPSARSAFLAMVEHRNIMETRRNAPPSPFQDEICSLFHLSCERDGFIMASISRFCSELILKTPSRWFNKKPWVLVPFGGCISSVNIPRVSEK